MQPYLTDPQALIGGFVLILALILALAAFLDYRRKSKPPILNYFFPEFDQDHPELGSLVEPGEWEAYYQSLLDARHGRKAGNTTR
jgi:hypothetical protein